MSGHAPKRTAMHPIAPPRTFMHPDGAAPARPGGSARPECTRMHPSAPECTPNFAFGETNPPPSVPRTPVHPDGAAPAPPGASARPQCTQMHPSAPECTSIFASGETNPPPSPPSPPSPPRLSLRQHAAIRYLVRGYPVGKIAAHLGISRHTITRWKHEATFVAELERLRREMTAAIVSPAAKATPPPPAMDPLVAYLRAQGCQEIDEEQEEEEEQEEDECDAGGTGPGDRPAKAGPPLVPPPVSGNFPACDGATGRRDKNVCATEMDDDFDDDFDDDEEEMSDEEFAETEAWVEELIRAGRAGKPLPPPPPGRDSR